MAALWRTRGARRWLGPAVAVPVLAARTRSDFTARRARRTFVDFFRARHQHRVVPSSPLRPRGDPSLLFVNAGMNQFKPLLLGTADPRSEMASYRRVVNSQKCVRAGGKHNDLEDVGRDVYHHTFFEMLGNWSFGDYFKEEACSMAWRLLTEEYGIPAERLYVSYFGGDAPSGLPADLETREIWRGLGVASGRVLPFGMRDNFWEMGDVGPCGPCTEIHYDHVGGRDASPLVNAGGPDVVEIWNLVFMQYNRETDRSLRPLPRRSVDTGMGLERLVAVLQGQRSNYDTDLFAPLLSAMHQRCKVPPYGGRTGERDAGRVDMAYRVVADHVRTLCVGIGDGIYPGMSGAELVLRRILRRAVRFSSELLRAPQGTLAALVPAVVHVLGDAYPELHGQAGRIAAVINENEEHFLSSLRHGRRVIDRTLHRMGDETLFPAPVAWSLHRNLGFPLDLVDLMLEETGRTVDRRGLELLAAEQEELRSQSQRGDGGASGRVDVHCLAELRDTGVPFTDDSPKYNYGLGANGEYEFPSCRAEVVSLYCGQQLVEEVAPGQACGVLLDRTCFYAEQGGQDHDLGYFLREGLQDVLFPVEGVHSVGGYVLHQVSVPEGLRIGDQVELYVDQTHRLSCMVKHTATHVVNFALKQLLGRDVEQRGSHVSACRLRFDFSVKRSLTPAELQQVEELVSQTVRQDQAVHTALLPLAVARTIPGVRAVDEVYPDPVRVVSVATPVSELLRPQQMAPTSVELCCGTHLLRTGAIGDLVIVSEKQLVRGISRIVAVTGDDAREAREAGRVLEQEVDSLVARVAAALSPTLSEALGLAKEAGQLTDAVEGRSIPQWQRRSLQAQLRGIQRATNTTIRKMEVKEAAVLAQDLLKRRGSRTVVVDTVDTDSMSVLMKTVNRYSDASPGCCVMLLSHQHGSGGLLCACQVPKDLAALQASDWALAVCGRLGGNAGGSATVAKGVASGSAEAVTETLRWALDFANTRAGRE
ncbi:alanine--tRNA ligase, mitochondrial isoform X2 [Denticeps clupeoides]|uniref:Alanine--tRNA ligase n=1 Tax=Denticeps clupeoides TaxID=299321 RepID=A0AAY4A861_9TELE|nr:alanine--tRNA ligase, mitochondrial isoform X2 [Denticeps clupeoides]